MSAAAIYDIEGIVEAASKVVLVDLALNAFTTQDPPDFQKVRPRVEIKCVLGPGLGRWALVNMPDGIPQDRQWYYRRESAWSCKLSFDLLTKAEIATHAAYRATVRSALAQLWAVINSVAPMTRHALQLVKDGGSSPILVAPEQGIMKTEISFDGAISVQANAWPALNQ